MKIRSNKFYAIFAAAFFASILAASAQAQWTLVRYKNDSEGKEIGRVERHTNGSIREMRRAYIAGTRVRQREMVITTAKDGSKIIIEERRDRFNRVIFTQNLFRNPKGVLTRGYQQYWEYRNDHDGVGNQKNFTYDPRTDAWKRM